MDPLCSRMVRAALCWLVAGALVGGLMLLDGVLPGTLAAWFAPSHAHMLFVGWFLQFALGVAYWLLPRKRTPSQPLGYNERLGTLAMLALNAGLLLRVGAEPIERMGRGNATTQLTLGLVALLQVGAILIFASQLWPRVGPRAPRPKNDTPA
ncbi:MAG: hypothetical protein KC442_20985 [Thermomicrobiales bacterium]|nr:hypothetical protein [Thermomicrobiales bacterium]